MNNNVKKNVSDSKKWVKPSIKTIKKDDLAKQIILSACSEYTLFCPRYFAR